MRFLSVAFGKFLRCAAARFIRKCIGKTHSRRVYEIALPSLLLDRPSRASTFPARKGSTLPNKGWRSNKGRSLTSRRHCATISTTYFRPVAFFRFLLLDSLFFPATRAPFLTPLPPHPDRTSSPTIALEPTPFPRLPTPLSLFPHPVPHPTRIFR